MFTFFADLCGPASFFFFLPFFPFPLPISTSITPQMKIYIKMISRDPIESTNKQPHVLGCNREAKMPLLLKRNMKTSGSSSKAAVESHGNRILSEPKEKSPKNHEQEEGTIRQGRSVMNRGRELAQHLSLKLLTGREIPVPHEFRQRWVLFQLNQGARRPAGQIHGRLAGAEQPGWGLDG
jgi:hypothetical protein